MLYASNAELPQAVRALPAPAQTIFRNAYNADAEASPDASEVQSFKAAWTAVQNDGWSKSDSGEWLKEAADDGSAAALAAFDDVVRPKRKSSKVKSINVREMIAMDDGARLHRTVDGYLAAYPRVARSGIQLYSGTEVGRPTMDVVRVYRPEAEVFHRDSINSYAHRPVTNDHPPELVTAENWSEYAVGQIGDEVLKDGQYVRVPMLLMDAGAVEDFECGKRELSLGYTMDLKWTPGVTPAGDDYDAIQTSIRANHLALVKNARGGPSLRIGDLSKGEDAMATKTITVDSIDITLEGRDAQIIERALKTATDAVAKLTAELATSAAAIALRDSQLSEAKKASEAADAKVAALEQTVKDKEMTPAQLGALVKDLAEVAVKAKAIIGDKLVVEGKSAVEMRRQVIDVKLGDKAKGWSDDQVISAFESFLATAPKSSALDDVLRAGPAIVDGSDRRKASSEAYDQMCNDLENAWKPKQAAH